MYGVEWGKRRRLHQSLTYHYQPNDNGYGGDEAKKDIKEIVKKYKHKGVLTFAAAIGDDKDRIKSIYGDGYINIEDISTLPKSLTKLVKKHLLD